MNHLNDTSDAVGLGDGAFPTWRRVSHHSTPGPHGSRGGYGSSTESHISSNQRLHASGSGGGPLDHSGNSQNSSQNPSRTTSSDMDDDSHARSQSRSIMLSMTQPVGRLTRSLRSALTSAREAAFTAFAPYAQDFRFKDFKPKIFARIRDMCGIDPEEYANSFETTCKEKFSEGKSGAFMFFSSNQKYIVKTTSKSEMTTLQRILPDYVHYMDMNPSSLILRILGAHCITMYGNELYFIVMLNFFPNFSLSERYDLKGSWVNRHGFTGSRRTKTERSRRELPDTPPLYMDNDFQHKLALEKEMAEALAEQIYKDIDFMQSKICVQPTTDSLLFHSIFSFFLGPLSEIPPSCDKLMKIA